jgi:hypothetical protein
LEKNNISYFAKDKSFAPSIFVVYKRYMPRKVFRRPDLEPLEPSDEYWAEDQLSTRPRSESNVCMQGTHRAPGYHSIRPVDTFCVRNCSKWNPPARRIKGGMCGINKRVRPPSAWSVGLHQYWEQRRQNDPNYAYKQAMIDFKPIYQHDRKDEGF